VSELDDFLHDVLPRLRAAEIALHEGDAGPRKELWSRTVPLTLLGAEVDRTGPEEVVATFDWVASRFTACQSLEYEILAAGASGDLAYLVTYEHITATVNGEATTYSLRSTTVFRREDGVWRVAHRHGDSLRS
jgi:ketosteroid isomerase-like protein